MLVCLEFYSNVSHRLSDIVLYSIRSVKVDDDSSIDGHRDLKSCASKERVLTVSLITDDYGYETSFTLTGPQGNLIARVPESDQTLRDNRSYTFQYCVNAGSQYKLKIIDKKGDGLVSNFCLTYLTSWNLLLCLLNSYHS